MARPSGLHCRVLSIEALGAKSNVFMGLSPSGENTPIRQCGFAASALYQQAIVPSRGETAGRVQMSCVISTGSPPLNETFQRWIGPAAAGRLNITHLPSGVICAQLLSF